MGTSLTKRRTSLRVSRLSGSATMPTAACTAAFRTFCHDAFDLKKWNDVAGLVPCRLHEFTDAAQGFPTPEPGLAKVSRWPWHSTIWHCAALYCRYTMRPFACMNLRSGAGPTFATCASNCLQFCSIHTCKTALQHVTSRKTSVCDGEVRSSGAAHGSSVYFSARLGKLLAASSVVRAPPTNH